jgi:hypothetical protein
MRHDNACVPIRDELAIVVLNYNFTGKRVPFPWQGNPGKYESINYTMDHLADFKRNVTDSGGTARQVLFSFRYHCFTDSPKAGGDFRTKFVDPAFHWENRVFCPKRWFLSRDLVKFLAGDLSKIDVVDASDQIGPQWVWNHHIPSIDKPYSVFFRFGASQRDCPLPIEIASGYIKSGGRITGKPGTRPHRLTSVIKLICGEHGSLTPAKPKK